MGGSVSATKPARCCSSFCHVDASELQPLKQPEPTGGIRNARSVIQFNAQTFFCSEEEGKAVIELVRLGDTTGQARCQVRTQNGSAKATQDGPGGRYIHRDDALVFEPGERLQQFEVKITEDDRYDAMLEFNLDISEVVNAVSGRYLSRCAVVVMDDDAFPTNRHKEVIEHCAHAEQRQTQRAAFVTQNALLEAEAEKSVTEFYHLGFRLVIEYFRFNFSHPVIFWRSLQWIGLDVIKGSYFVFSILLMQYLVDDVIVAEEVETGGSLLNRFVVGCSQRLADLGFLKHDHDSEMHDHTHIMKVHMLIIVALLHVVPFFLVQAIDMYKVSLRIPGISRKMLQGNLFRRFLYFDPVRSTTGAGEIAMAMSRDIPDIVQNGFMKVLGIFENLTKLPLLALFFYAKNPRAMYPLAVFPAVMLAFLVVREKRITKLTSEMNTWQNNMIKTVTHAAHNIHAIQGFFMGVRTSQRCEENIDAFNARALAWAKALVVNLSLAPMLTTLLVGWWIIYGTMQVHQFGGHISIGTFMATIHVFKDVGALLQAIYSDIMTMLTTIGPLQRTTLLLNQPTDLEHRKTVLDERREFGRTAWDAQIQKHKRRGSFTSTVHSDNGCDRQEVVPVGFAVDAIPIEVRNLAFSYHEDQSWYVFSGLEASFPQGRLHAIVGSKRKGKATLLKLIGSMFVPHEGQVLVPPHLRVLHVPQNAGIMDVSLWDNLVMDSVDPTMTREQEQTRVLSICGLCGFSAEQLEVIKRSKAQSGDPSHTHSVKAIHSSLPTQTDMARLNLARALVVNPELLVMHMPCIAFSDEDAQDLMAVLHEHVVSRGLGLGDSSLDTGYLRRPRTVFFSSSSIRRVRHADSVYVLDEKEHAGITLRLVPEDERQKFHERGGSLIDVQFRDTQRPEESPPSEVWTRA